MKKPLFTDFLLKCFEYILLNKGLLWSSHMDLHIMDSHIISYMAFGFEVQR